jgi:hypothetical protein
MESMGKKVKFAIDEVCQGAGRTAAVMWHLGKITASLNYKVIEKSGRTMMPVILLATEWNGYIIPFTKGCSFYICSANGAALLIR